MESEKTCHLTATCAAGIEELCAGEIRMCGGTVADQAKGHIQWTGGLEAAYRMCLYSRFASRILLKIAEFQVTDEDGLYRACRKIDWEEHMGLEATFAVDCTLSGSKLKHSHFAALRVKDAVADQFMDRYGSRPSVNVDRPDLRIRLHVQGETAVLAIDLSGQSLHRRGYRIAGGGTAPLKESLAAAMVTLSGWGPDHGKDVMFLDPMCGSGTLLIEAALIYGDSAPGLSRSYFGLEGWKGHDARLWSRIVSEAVQREEQGLERPWPVFMGYDADPEMVSVARKNIEQAGLSDRIIVKRAQLAHLKRPCSKGFVVTNPPYGERLLERQESIRLYQAIGHVFRKELHGWKAGILASDPDMGDRTGIRWEKGFRLYNGPIRCRLFTGVVPEDDAQEFHWHLGPLPDQMPAQAFANRLRKNFKRIAKRARRSGITCYRVYDRDIPEYNVAVDIYEKWVLVQEYAPPASIAPEVAAERFSNVLLAVREVLGVGRDRLFIKTRRRQRGKQQYQKSGRSGKMYVVREGECRFLVNFTDYIDTGLFLDHRITRQRIGKEAAGKRFLNLYAYTGTATVHAAMGGAELTTTVDLSANYLAWARQNMCLNGLGGPAHEFVRADCMEWLQQCKGVYDLIFVDPPTFSNTRKKGRVFDVQKDHSRLLKLAMNVLAPGGLLVFSTNFRRFRMDAGLEGRFNVKEISRSTLPFDFERNPRIHRCWEFRHA